MRRVLAACLFITLVTTGVMGESVFLPSYNQAKQETTNRRLVALGGLIVATASLAMIGAGDSSFAPLLLLSVGTGVGSGGFLFSQSSKQDMERFEKAMEIERVLSAREKQAILDSFIFVGMSEPSLRLAWGSPLRINRSSHGPDQYVYSNYRYVYVNNKGIVEAWN